MLLVLWLIIFCNFSAWKMAPIFFFGTHKIFLLQLHSCGCSRHSASLLKRSKKKEMGKGESEKSKITIKKNFKMCQTMIQIAVTLFLWESQIFFFRSCSVLSALRRKLHISFVPTWLNIILPAAPRSCFFALCLMTSTQSFKHTLTTTRTNTRTARRAEQLK